MERLGVGVADLVLTSTPYACEVGELHKHDRRPGTVPAGGAPGSRQKAVAARGLGGHPARPALAAAPGRPLATGVAPTPQGEQHDQPAQHGERDRQGVKAVRVDPLAEGETEQTGREDRAQVAGGLEET